MAKKVIVIGCGFAGLSAACFMAKAGWKVKVLEKNDAPGGRAAQLKMKGFKFDMGPSWYWMPDVFEKFFAAFGKKVEDYYSLTRLDPSYEIYWKDDESKIPADYNELKIFFDQTEKGSSKNLDKFLKEAEYKYKAGMHNLVYKPGISLTEYFDWKIISGIFRLDVFSSVKTHIAKYFKHRKLKQILEFPTLFLGALPKNTPALYSLMNYADIKKGTWYPSGGMYSVVEGMYKLALELGVEFSFNHNVTQLIIEKNKVKNVIVANQQPAENSFKADVIIAAADYHFVETVLLPKAYRSYSENYWNTRVLAPGCLLYFIGLNKRLKNISHHSLFFDTSFEKHAKEIYKTKQWPTEPLFYVCAPSVSDDSVAPEGCENLFILIPVASGLLNDTEELRECYFNIIMERMEERLKQSIRNSIIFKQTFAQTEFVNKYNSFKGNAYGLANTLMQTAVLKPRCRSKKVSNLFYAGQFTVPGPGVPPCIISGEVAANEVMKRFG